jgi:hypothetical protein
MKDSCVPGQGSARDLTHTVWAWLLWCIPVALLIAGGAWRQGGAWLWALAFAVMGAGCLANAMRCGRVHCYVTGPLFVLAAVWSLLSALGVTPLHATVLSLLVLGLVSLAFLAEIPFGRYGKAHR